MNRRFGLLSVLAASAFVSAATAHVANAGTYTFTWGQFDSNLYAGTPVTYDLGAFLYSIPSGETIISANLSGHTGNTNVNSTAPFDLKLDGILADHVTSSSPDFSLGQPFSYDFAPSELGIFGDGSVDLTVTQTGDFVVRLAPTTVTITTRVNATTSTPEPGMVVTTLSMVGMTGLGMVRGRVSARRKKNSAA